MSLPKIHGIFRIHTKEIKYTQDGTPILNMNVVASDKYKTKAGEEREDVCWITAVSFARQAEIINQHFHEKGRILIHGSLKQETWEQDGQKRSKHVIKIKEFEFVDAKSNTRQNNQDDPSRHNISGSLNKPAQHQAPTQNQSAAVPEVDIDFDQIPFGYIPKRLAMAL